MIPNLYYVLLLFTILHVNALKSHYIVINTDFFVMNADSMGFQR